MLHRPVLLLAGALCCAAAARAAIPAPPPPETYDVTIRYRIQAFRTQRVAQYYEMMRFLQAHGFQRDPNEEVPEDEPENPEATLLHGTIPSRRVTDLLAERHIKTVLLLPHGQQLPEDKAQLVRVDMRLRDGFPPDVQRVLHEQTRDVLASIQFREAVGYDHGGFTRLLGAIPSDRVPSLLNDLRKLPAGARQGPPFASRDRERPDVGEWPVRMTLALPDMPAPAPRARPEVIPPGREKLTQDLREALANKAAAGTPRRLEVLLAVSPPDSDRAWLRGITGSAAGVIVEGRVGPLVTVVAPLAAAVDIAARPEVDAVRLPRAARPGSMTPGGSDETWRPLLAEAGVARLQDLKHKGRGSRVAVIDSDFSGWQALVGKQLPEHARLLDLTTERNADLRPDPSPGPAPGPGTRRAVVLSRVAPEADLTLIRVDPAAAYMVYQVARGINGDPYLSVSLDNRLDQLDTERRRLDERREKLLEERKIVFESFEQEGEPARRREAYLKAQAEFDRDQREHNARVQRLFQYQQETCRLRGIRLVASALIWDEGYPTNGTSTLSRYIDDRPFRAALWFQAAGDSRGQNWSGLFRDADGNGVMEFTPPDAPLPQGLWTPELNFLSWRGAGNTPALDIPGNTRLRISLQWQEAHEGLYQRVGEDPYREPLARLRLVVLQQPDPAGRRRPADDLVVVKQSAGLPQRLEQTLHGATYEQTVEVQVGKGGRYAVRIEGRQPAGILPPDAPTVPAAQKVAPDLRVRLFVTTLSGPGRAVWRDFATAVGSQGMPGDARTAVTVGSADEAGRPQPYSAGGPPFTLELLPKPDVLAFDKGAGTAEAAAFAAGMAAAAGLAGPSRESFLLEWLSRPGSLLRVPAGGRGCCGIPGP
jgi:hypothetical protein